MPGARSARRFEQVEQEVEAEFELIRARIEELEEENRRYEIVLRRRPTGRRRR